MLFWLAVLASLGCSDSAPSDHGTGGGAGEAAGGSITGGGSAGTAGADGGSSGNAGTSAGSGGKSSPEGGSGGTPISGAGGGGDGNTPDCMAPCFFELLGACRPTSACTTDGTGGPDQLLLLECDASNGWRLEYDDSPEGTAPNLTVTLNGDVCYTAVQDFESWSYYDAAGELTAIVSFSGGNEVAYCPRLDPEGNVPYPQDRNDARCASPTCGTGSCP